MKILKKIEFSEVLSVFDREHPAKDGTNGWAREMLENANKKFSGEWHKVRLSRKDALSTLLVWHHDPKEGLMLIPEYGMTVQEAAKKWKKIRIEYQKENKSCYEKIMKFGKDPFSMIFLSVEPTRGCGVMEYEMLKHQNGSLVHLDGLHRLIAWATAGKFGRFRYYFGKKLDVFIAGHLG